MNKYKRGDRSPCGTKRFLQYQTYVSKKTGQRCERWVPIDQYERTIKDIDSKRELYAARREFHLAQKTKPSKTHTSK